MKFLNFLGATMVGREPRCTVFQRLLVLVERAFCFYAIVLARMILELRRCTLLLTIVISFVGTMMAQTSSWLPKRDINAALAARDKKLLAIPRALGVYVGDLSDQKTPCLKIMLARPTPEADRDIRRQPEGHPVIVEVNGEIRPLCSP